MAPCFTKDTWKVDWTSGKKVTMVVPEIKGANRW